MRRVIGVIMLWVWGSIGVFAQADDTSILFMWQNTLYAQPINGNNMIQVGMTRDGFESLLTTPDVYNLDASPVSEAHITEGYGFHHGLWSADKQQFVYLELSPTHYRVRLWTAEADNTILLDNQMSANLGYLDPIAWTAEGDILLLERVALNHLQKVNVFRLNPNSGGLEFHTLVLSGHLVGRTAWLADGVTVFVGFDMSRQIGILLDTLTGQIRTFPTTFQDVLPPTKGFEYYPIPVLGALTQADLITFANDLNTLDQTRTASPQPEPFLHWALADEHRYITCYADSTWTRANFATTCPGLAGRNYEGHQGTDVSDEPDGLYIGTPVYPSAIGAVVASYRACLGQNPSCNDSYGNTVTLEHIRIVEHEVQVWYTGYGHLQMVIPTDATWIGNLRQPIALSGATGVGGAHLHFEVRNIDGWVDPWDNRMGQALWVMDGDQPRALVDQADMTAIPKILDVCTSYAGNNIRSGAGTSFANIGKTTDNTTYYITTIEYVASGDAVGDWYHVLFDGNEGWLWSGVMNCP